MSTSSFRLFCLVLLAFHGLLLSHSFERSADGWIHLFFADHWLRFPTETWEWRWSQGISLFSYPPLAHQWLALCAKILGLVTSGILNGVLFTGLLAWGFYRYSRCCFQENISQWSTLALLSSSSLALTLHSFAQLPNLLALACLFHSMAYWDEWLNGHKPQAKYASFFVALSGAFCSLYIGVFGLSLLALPILYKQRLHWRRSLGLLALLGVAILVLMSPHLYFQLFEAATDASPVYHASRDNVLSPHPFNWYMFYGLYGAWILLLPWSFKQAFQKPTWRLWSFLTLILFGLSLGGANPLNSLLLGKGFDTLTFDRFGQWNSWLMLPLCLDTIWEKLKKWPLKYARWSWGLLITAHLLSSAYTYSLNERLPQTLDVSPFLTHLAQAEHAQYRYLTLGWDRASMAKLSTLSSRHNLDGHFPFGRQQAILNKTGLAMLNDVHLYATKGQNTLQAVLMQHLHLKTIFVHPAASSLKALLVHYHWRMIAQHQGIEVWTLTTAEPMPPLQTPQQPPLLKWIWIALPLLIGGLGLFISFKMAHVSAQRWV